MGKKSKRGDICICEGLPNGSVGKESACIAGDIGDSGSIPGLGRCPGGGHGNPLQCSCLETPMDRGAWRLQDTTEPPHTLTCVCETDSLYCTVETNNMIKPLYSNKN